MFGVEFAFVLRSYFIKMAFLSLSLSQFLCCLWAVLNFLCKLELKRLITSASNCQILLHGNIFMHEKSHWLTLSYSRCKIFYRHSDFSSLGPQVWPSRKLKEQERQEVGIPWSNCITTQHNCREEKNHKSNKRKTFCCKLSPKVQPLAKCILMKYSKSIYSSAKVSSWK